MNRQTKCGKLDTKKQVLYDSTYMNIRIGKFIEAENRFKVTRDCEEGGRGSYCLLVTLHCKCTNATELYTSK